MAVDLATVQFAMAALEATGQRRSCNAVWRTLQGQGHKVDRHKVKTLYKEALLLRWAPTTIAPVVVEDDGLKAVQQILAERQQAREVTVAARDAGLLK